MSARREPGAPARGRRTGSENRGSAEPAVIPAPHSNRPTLPRTEVLRRKADLTRVLRTGTRLSGPLVSLRYAKSPDAMRRVAFLLPRGMKRAVDRNRLKRRMREVYRLNKQWFAPEYDYVLQPALTAAGADFAALARATETIAARLAHAIKST